MGKESNISWTDSSWNPWYGCRKVSPACAYCYAERDMKRYGKDFNKVTRAKDATFYAPLKWKEPRRIFTCSWSDFFIEEADSWRPMAWKIILENSRHTYLILTKRIERAAEIWGKVTPSNVYLGVSVENQRQLDERWPLLREIPAEKRFLSIEPLLSEIDLQPLFYEHLDHWTWPNWVIVGGESGGPEHRRLVQEICEGTIDPRFLGNRIIYEPKPKALQWVHSLRDQCQAAGIPFFFKQWGGPKPHSGGRLLDGKEWSEMP